MDSVVENKKIQILLVEEDPLETLLIRRALKKVDGSFILTPVRNGVQALDYLLKQGDYEDVSKPDLIILDVDLPRLNGYQLLDIMQSKDELKNIPRIVMGNSTGQVHTNRPKNLLELFFENSKKESEFTQVIDVIGQYLKKGF